MKKIVRMIIVVTMFVVLALVCASCDSNDESFPESLELQGGKIAFNLGEDFDKGNITVFAVYADGNKESVDISLCTVDSTAYDKTKEGEYSITISYKDKSAFYVVKVSSLQNATFTVTFDSMGGTPVQSKTSISPQTTISCPDSPTKDKAVFDCWCINDRLITAFDFSSPITNNIILYARWIPTYTVIWQNGSEELEKDSDVLQNALPSYDGAVPQKEKTTQYSYTFTGWSPTIVKAEADMIYTAQFSEKLNYYSVTFYDEDGETILDRISVPCGGIAEYSKAIPIKNATNYYTYAFDRWVTERDGENEASFANIECDMQVYASFTSSIRKVNVSIVSNNADYGTVSISIMENVPYGATIVVSNDAIQIGEDTVTANPTLSSAQYEYAFYGWSSPATVTNDTIITANFTCSLVNYTIVWMNEDVVLETDERVPFGTTPKYDGAVPTKQQTVQNKYAFSGWSPKVSTVSDDVIYYAQFLDIKNKYTVTFYDEDGSSILGAAAVEYGEAASFPYDEPTKTATERIIFTFDKWVTLNGGETEASLSNITRNTSVYAKYSAAVRTYTVTFCDYDGTTIEEVAVPYSGDATAPLEPDRDGYRNNGWDKSFMNVTHNIMVFALYIQQVEVTFVDYNNAVIDVQYVDCGGDAIAPQAPTRQGYRFVGWNTTFADLVEDITIRAQYTGVFTVRFLDADKTLLHSETVPVGQNATPPTDPSKVGYHFIGWDISYENINSDLNVTARYDIITYSVYFLMPDNSILYNADGTESQIVEYGSFAIAPNCAESFYNSTEHKAYTFTKWSRSFDRITDAEDELDNNAIYVLAKYESPCSIPVLAITYSSTNTGITPNIVISLPTNCKLYALDFEIQYITGNEQAGENIVVNAVNYNSAVNWLNGSIVNTSYNSEINNKEKVYEFAWSYGNGVSFAYQDFITGFAIETSGGAQINCDTFHIKECSTVISFDDGETLQMINPIIVYIN